jgi:hypothetical protein
MLKIADKVIGFLNIYQEVDQTKNIFVVAV